MNPSATQYQSGIGGQDKYGNAINLPFGGTQIPSMNTVEQQRQNDALLHGYSNAPTVVSNYNTQQKVNDVNQAYQTNASTVTPPFPTGTKRAVYAPSGDGSTGEFLGYAGTPQEEQSMLGSFNQKSQTSFGTDFNAPSDAQLQPDGTYLYQGQYYTKDQLSSPESLAAISNTSAQQKKYDLALQDQLNSINKRYDMYLQQQQAVTQSGAAGAQNALLQSGAGGRGSVAQYAAVTADARVNSIMADGQRALQELDSQRDQLLSAARIAYQDKDTALLKDLNAQITKNRDAMLAVSNKANEELAKETKNAKKDTDIANAYDAVGADPIAILNKLKESGITNVTSKEIIDTVDRFTNQQAIDDIGLAIAKAGNDPSIIKGAKTVSEAIEKGASGLRSVTNEVIKVGDNAYLIDKSTGKIIKSFGVPTGGGGGGIKGKNSGIAETIIASGKFTAQQASSIRNAINNGEDPVAVIKNNAKNIMGQTLATDLDKAETALSQLESIDSVLKDYYAKGGKTDIFKGNYEKVLNKLGEVKDPKLVEIATEIALAMQAYRLAVTGTAASVQEDARIDNVFPGITDGEILNNAKTKATIKSFNNKIDSSYRNTLGSAYDSLKQVEKQIEQPLSKGTMDDHSFVEKALSSKNIKYQDVVNGTQAGEIPVLDNVTGEPVYILIGEFDPKKYTKL
jgi:hypothetical protein